MNQKKRKEGRGGWREGACQVSKSYKRNGSKPLKATYLGYLYPKSLLTTKVVGLLVVSITELNEHRMIKGFLSMKKETKRCTKLENIPVWNYQFLTSDSDYLISVTSAAITNKLPQIFFKFFIRSLQLKMINQAKYS